MSDEPPKPVADRDASAFSNLKPSVTPNDPLYEFVIACSVLGNFREYLKRWMIYYQSLPETAIMPNHPHEIVQQLHSIDRAYTMLLKESHRLN